MMLYMVDATDVYNDEYEDDDIDNIMMIQWW